MSSSPVAIALGCSPVRSSGSGKGWRALFAGVHGSDPVCWHRAWQSSAGAHATVSHLPPGTNLGTGGCSVWRHGSWMRRPYNVSVYWCNPLWLFVWGSVPVRGPIESLCGWTSEPAHTGTTSIASGKSDGTRRPVPSHGQFHRAPVRCAQSEFMGQVCALFACVEPAPRQPTLAYSVLLQSFSFQ